MDAGWNGEERRRDHICNGEELAKLSAAVFGRRRNAFSPRQEGILDRLDRLERLIRYGVAGAAWLGTMIGSLGTLVIQHVWR